MGLYVGKVVSVDDNADAGRIKVRVRTADRTVSDANLSWAFPLLPKTFNVIPKVGEFVVLLTETDTANSQRYYIGPLISDMEHLDKDIDGTKFLSGRIPPNKIVPSMNQSLNGCFPEQDEVALMGRKNSDIILGDDDIRIRCGVRKTKRDGSVEFNRSKPSYIKLKYNPDGENEESSATIVADKINLISNNSIDPRIETVNSDGGITDDEMKKILEQAHQLPYGDVLVDFLFKFVEMFKSHTHKWHNWAPCPDNKSKVFDMSYGTTKERYEKVMLSKDVRIN